MNNLKNKLYSFIPYKEKVGAFAYEKIIIFQRKFIGAKRKIIGDTHYLEINKGHPETILLVHGFTDSKDGFLPAALFLSRKYNLIIPDLPGSGENKKCTKETYNVSYLAEGLAQFLRKLNIKSIHVVGISMGAAVSMELTLMYPILVKSLGLVSPAGFFDKEIPNIFHEMIGGKNIFCVDSFDDYENLLDRVLVKKLYIPLPIKQHLFRNLLFQKEWLNKMTKDLLGGVNSITEFEKIQKNSFNDRSKDIKCQTFLLWGDRDTLFPLELSQIPLLKIENSELMVLENAGHALHHERPLDFAKSVHKFIQNKIYLIKN